MDCNADHTRWNSLHLPSLMNFKMSSGLSMGGCQTSDSSKIAFTLPSRDENKAISPSAWI